MSSSFILLDTPGHHFESIDSNGWKYFLNLLVDNRRYLSIEGAILCIDINKIKAFTQQEVREHIEPLRNSIFNLIENLAKRLPIYVIFTKFDLVYGFKEFFGKLNDNEKKQVLGYTLSNDNLSIEGREEIFKQQIDILHASISDFRILKQSESVQDLEKMAINRFPEEFDNLKENLKFIIHNLLLEDINNETLLLRGLYFTSSEQNGTPESSHLKKLADDFGIVLNSQNLSASTKSESYFVEELFNTKHLFYKTLFNPVSKLKKFNLFQKTVTWYALPAIFSFITTILLFIIFNTFNKIDQNISPFFIIYSSFIVLIVIFIFFLSFSGSDFEISVYEQKSLGICILLIKLVAISFLEINLIELIIDNFKGNTGDYFWNLLIPFGVILISNLIYSFGIIFYKKEKN